MSYPKSKKTGSFGGKKYARKDSFRRDPARRSPAGATTMHSAICSECDQECEVPFKPFGDKPVFCKKCFKSEGRDGGEQRMHKTTCDTCGKTCEVPFRPSGEKPIYCNQCFGKSSGKTFSKHNTGGNGDGMSQEQFKILNAKLDKILAALDSGK